METDSSTVAWAPCTMEIDGDIVVLCHIPVPISAYGVEAGGGYVGVGGDDASAGRYLFYSTDAENR